MNKFIKTNFHDYLIRLTTSSFVQNLSAISEFRGEDDFRRLREIKAGVPRVLVLPLLCTYTLYIKDIPTYVRERAALSADDTVLFSFDANTDMETLNLQRALINLQTWCSIRDIATNGTKHRRCSFLRDRKSLEIPWVTLTEKLTFKNHEKGERQYPQEAPWAYTPFWRDTHCLLQLTSPSYRLTHSTITRAWPIWLQFPSSPAWKHRHDRTQFCAQMENFRT